MNLDKITEAVKMGVAMAGGTPIVVPAIAVCDGIAMGHIGMKYSLVTRDLIADSTEALAMAHQFDGLVMIPNCDKNVPGLLMAAARVNIPTIFVSGGPMLAGHVKGEKTSLSSMFEAVGAHAAGRISDEELCEYENKACPTCGSCSGMYTANSMNCLTEALGMGLRGNGTIPAVYSARLQLAKHAGMQVMELVRKNIRPRDIMTEDAILNALTVDMALGCSTNSMLHLPAIAHEIGMDFEIDFANSISEKTPNLCHLAPAGHTYIEDLNEAGGVYAVMNELSKKNLLNLDCMTVTGKTVGENIAGCENLSEVYCPRQTPPEVQFIHSMANAGSGAANAPQPPFDKIAADAVLYVPIGTKSLYEASMFAKGFAEIRETADFPADINDEIAASDGCSVTGGKGCISISANGEPIAYKVYAAGGQLVAEGVADGTDIVEAPAGICIVSAHGEKTKVVVR